MVKNLEGTALIALALVLSIAGTAHAHDVESVMVDAWDDNSHFLLWNEDSGYDLQMEGAAGITGNAPMLGIHPEFKNLPLGGGALLLVQTFEVDSWQPGQAYDDKYVYLNLFRFGENVTPLMAIRWKVDRPDGGVDTFKGVLGSNPLTGSVWLGFETPEGDQILRIDGLPTDSIPFREVTQPLRPLP